MNMFPIRNNHLCVKHGAAGRSRSSNQTQALGFARGIVSGVSERRSDLSMIDWHSFLQVKRLPRRSLRGPLTIPVLSPDTMLVLQSGSSFTKDRIDKVAPKSITA